MRGAGEVFEGKVEVVADWRIRREHQAEVFAGATHLNQRAFGLNQRIGDAVR